MSDPSDLNFAAALFPEEVERLAPREREVARIVYRHGSATAKEVQARLSAAIDNGAVRSMLVRLVNKGILSRASGGRGRGREYQYTPAIDAADFQQRALKQVADLYFDGSMIRTAMAALQLTPETAHLAGIGATHAGKVPRGSKALAA